MSSYLVYRNRHILSWCPAILVGAYFIFLAQPEELKIEPKYDEKPIEIVLAEPEPEPVVNPPVPQVTAPPPVVPPAPEPEVPVADAIEQVKPKPKVKPEVKPKVEPEIKPKVEPKQKPVEEKKVEKPVEQTKPAEPTPHVETKHEKAAEEKPVVAEKPKPVAEHKPAEPPKPASSGGNASAEARYLQTVRSAVEQQKRYPTGREASLERPEGNVEVWLEVDRSGRVIDAGVLSKSKSMLLNRAALSSLKNIKQVEPFPADAFAGESQKRFVATLNYTAP